MGRKEGEPLQNPSVRARLEAARVARLGTADARNWPHLVPVCFVYDGDAFYTPLDLKPKRAAPEQLARVRHIRARPQVAVLIDEYQEDWERLWYILVRGVADLLGDTNEEYEKACSLLKKKYPQYRAGYFSEGAPMIRILPRRTVFWGKL